MIPNWDNKPTVFMPVARLTWDSFPPENISIDVDISQKEKKFIEQYISNIVSNINFEG